MILLNETRASEKRILDFLKSAGYNGNEIKYAYIIQYVTNEDGTISKYINKYDVSFPELAEFYDYNKVSLSDGRKIKVSKFYHLDKNPTISADFKKISLYILSPDEEFFNKNLFNFEQKINVSLIDIAGKLEKNKQELEILVEKHIQKIKIYDQFQKSVQSICVNSIINNGGNV